ncbi:exo-alpha-sialidase [Helicobacter sp. 11S02629-2]|uniref:exo-alpha-sialidase n=1 Tax=Helicobacter sp. 11S02629-2 TaxID=1476195 RepID=UPI000BA5AA40|nr:exo-alpha-sialidase [Helicobacter sp. 11S02629-2]PAF45285.1 hypothetical protein BKH40_03555 [Helicobacter sp. 11S02629-2]
MKHIVFYVLLGIIAFGGMLYYAVTKGLHFEEASLQTAKVSSKLAKSKSYINVSYIKGTTHVVHSPSIARIDSSAYLVGFFGGSREGAKDVKIYASIFYPKQYSYHMDKSLYSTDANSDRHSKVLPILDRMTLRYQTKHYISKLGNPVLFTKGDTIYLSVVAPSFGGWATARIYLLSAPIKEVKDYFEGRLTKSPFKLVNHFLLSSFFNLSHLVRTEPISLDDNRTLLPLYFEMGRKLPLLAVLDSKFNVAMLLRPTTIPFLLQPSLVPFDKYNCLLAYRNGSHTTSPKLYLQTCKTANGTLTFGTPYESTINNFDSSIGLFNLNHIVAMVYNEVDSGDASKMDESTEKNTREKLSLALFEGEDFVKVDTLAYRPKGHASYPSIVTNGDYAYIAFSDSNESIGIISMNTSFLKEKEKLLQKDSNTSLESKINSNFARTKVLSEKVGTRKSESKKSEYSKEGKHASKAKEKQNPSDK